MEIKRFKHIKNVKRPLCISLNFIPEVKPERAGNFRALDKNT